MVIITDAYQDGAAFYGRIGAGEVSLIWTAPFRVPDGAIGDAIKARQHFERHATNAGWRVLYEPLTAPTWKPVDIDHGLDGL